MSDTLTVERPHGADPDTTPPREGPSDVASPPRSWSPRRLASRLRERLERATPRQLDALWYGAFVVAALALTVRLWWGGASVMTSANPQDQEFFEWNLQHAAYALTHGVNPLFSDRMNPAQGGVNLMANTSVLLLGVPLAPITLLFGAHTSFALFIVLALAGTASAWYYVLSRHIVSSRLAAGIGAMVAGFAPGMISHAGGQPNISAQFLLPFLVLAVLRLGAGGRWLRSGVVLGLLAVLQVFLNEEILFFTALGCLFALTTYCLSDRAGAKARAPEFLKGLGVAVLVAASLLAYPLWFQFFGPQHYRGLPFEPDRFVADVMSYPGLARDSLGGSPATAGAASISPTEDNAFFGWGLLALCAAVAWWQRRLVVVRMAAVTAIGFALMSFGPRLVVDHERTPVPGPMALLAHLPVLDLITVARFSLMVVPCLAVLLAVGIERYGALLAESESAGAPAPRSLGVMRGLGLVFLALALVPIVPTPLNIVGRPAPPAFFTNGEWRSMVPAGKTLLVVPVPGREVISMRWSIATGLELPTAQGYFLGPSADSDQAIFGAPLRPTITLLNRVREKKKIPAIGDAQRTQAREDLAFLRAGLVVLNSNRAQDPVLTALDELLGPGEKRDGVWLWRVA